MSEVSRFPSISYKALCPKINTIIKTKKLVLLQIMHNIHHPPKIWILTVSISKLTAQDSSVNKFVSFRGVDV